MAKPNEIFSYELVSGLAVRDYRAVVTLLPSDGGTVIHWRSTFKAKVPGTGWIYQRQLSAFIGRDRERPGRVAARAASTRPEPS